MRPGRANHGHWRQLCARLAAVALAPTVAFAGISAASADVPPPEIVVTPPMGGSPALPGHSAAAPRAKLPPLEAAAPRQGQPRAEGVRAPRRAAERAPKPTPTPRPVAARAPPPERVPTWVINVDGGGLWVPDALIEAAGFVGYAKIRGVGLDVSVLRATSARHALGGRLGVSVPNIGARNWWGSGRAPTYVDVDAVFVDLAFEYAYWRPLFGPVAFVGRAGAGLSFVAGGARRVATLPTCKVGAEASCPHWREVGELSDPLATPVLPALRATAGLAVEIAAGLHLRAEAGLRQTPYVGVGFGLRR